MLRPKGTSRSTIAALHGISAWIIVIHTILPSELSAAAGSDRLANQASRVTGTIVNEKLQPVIGVSIGIIQSESVRRVQKLKPEVRLNTRTDAKGEFSILIPAELRSVRLVARANGYLPAHFNEMVLDGTHQRIAPVRLLGGLRLQGRVLNEKGRPVQAALVFVRHEDELQDTIPDSERIAHARSESHGGFWVTGLAPGTYSLTAKHAGYAPRTMRKQLVHPTTANKVLEITMFTGTYISGSVVDSATSSPVRGAGVTARAGFEEQIAASSDELGHFRIGPFPEGANVEMIAAATGFSPARSDGIVAPFDDLVIPLTRNGALRGRVLDASSNRPVETFRVSFHRRHSVPLRSSPFPGARTLSASDGRFEWLDIPVGEWTFTVDAPGYQPHTTLGLNIPSGGVTQVLEIALARSHLIAGRIFESSTGLAVSSATIALLDADRLPNSPDLNEPMPRTLSDDNGEFLLPDVPSGRVRLVVAAQNFAHAERDVIVSSDTRVNIGLDAGGVISGQIVGSDGITPTQAIVQVRDLGKATGGAVPSDPDGTFVFKNISPGHYRLRAESPAGRSETVGVALDQNQKISGILLRLGAGASVHGRLLGLLPGERGRSRIAVRSEMGVPVSVATDANEAYVIRGLASGRVELVATTSLDRELARTIDLSVGETATVDFNFPAGVRLSGRVTRDGKPARFVMLSATPIENQRISGSGETSHSGQYVIEGLEKGTYAISAQGRDVRTVALSGDTRLDIDLPANAVNGQVIDSETREPVSAAIVEIRRSDQTQGGPAIRAATNYQGQFSLRGLEPGAYRLSATKPGYDLTDLPVSVDASQVEVIVAISTATGAILRVLDKVTGLPLRAVIVDTASATGERHRFEVPLDSDGTTSLPPSLKGRRMAVSWLGYAPAFVEAWDGSALNILLSLQEH